MPVVRVTWLAGRSHEQRAELAKVITEAVARIGKTSPQHTQIIFEDVAHEDWSTAGVLKSDES